MNQSWSMANMSYWLNGREYHLLPLLCRQCLSQSLPQISNVFLDCYQIVTGHMHYIIYIYDKAWLNKLGISIYNLQYKQTKNKIKQWQYKYCADSNQQHKQTNNNIVLTNNNTITMQTWQKQTTIALHTPLGQTLSNDINKQTDT